MIIKRLGAAAFALAIVFACAGIPARGDVTVPKILSSHMVVQRDRPIHLWGWADPGERVAATLREFTASTQADDLGRWSLYLAPEPAGGPYRLTIKGHNTLILDDVLVGDVWFASGQSNMQLPLMGFPGNAVVTNGAEEIRQAYHTDLRLLHIPDEASHYARQDQPASWTACTPQTAATFSAAAYFFARELAKRERVPIGIIDCSWGGTPAAPWVSPETLGSDAGLMPVFAEWASTSADHADAPRLLAKEHREDLAARAAGRPLPQHPWHPDLDSWAPGWLYNGMIAPAVNYPIKGVIWYQGASDTDPGRASMYGRVFPALIRDWRRQWREGDFPFLFVQIASFDAGPGWPIVREAQRRTLHLANTAMVVTIDIGNPHNIHPADKQDVGHRLALAARALAYGERIEYSGPSFRQTSLDGDRIRAWFDHADGLTAKGGPLVGFEIAGADRTFRPATARIDGDSVWLSSPRVPHPRYVRYAWASDPVANLFNGAGLPASPFTSERNIPNP
ncbi:MAG: sialate O-acetylesterase [Opitutaceae bacterium]